MEEWRRKLREFLVEHWDELPGSPDEIERMGRFIEAVAAEVGPGLGEGRELEAASRAASMMQAANIYAGMWHFRRATILDRDSTRALPEELTAARDTMTTLFRENEAYWLALKRHQQVLSETDASSLDMAFDALNRPPT